MKFYEVSTDAAVLQQVMDAQGLCAGVLSDTWTADEFRARVSPVDRPHLEATARRLCEGCPVMAECLAYALDTQQRDGVWGGLAAHELYDAHQAIKRVGRAQPLPRRRRSAQPPQAVAA